MADQFLDYAGLQTYSKELNKNIRTFPSIDEYGFPNMDQDSLSNNNVITLSPSAMYYSGSFYYGTSSPADFSYSDKTTFRQYLVDNGILESKFGDVGFGNGWFYFKDDSYDKMILFVDANSINNLYNTANNLNIGDTLFINLSMGNSELLDAFQRQGDVYGMDMNYLEIMIRTLPATTTNTNYHKVLQKFFSLTSYTNSNQISSRYICLGTQFDTSDNDEPLFITEYFNEGCNQFIKSLSGSYSGMLLLPKATTNVNSLKGNSGDDHRLLSLSFNGDIESQYLLYDKDIDYFVSPGSVSMQGSYDLRTSLYNYGRNSKYIPTYNTINDLKYAMDKSMTHDFVVSSCGSYYIAGDGEDVYYLVIVLHRGYTDYWDTPCVPSPDAFKGLDHIRLHNFNDWDIYCENEPVGIKFYIYDPQQYDTFIIDSLYIPLEDIDPRVLLRKGTYTISRNKYSPTDSSIGVEIGSAGFLDVEVKNLYNIDTASNNWKIDSSGPAILVVDSMPEVRYPNTIYMLRS